VNGKRASISKILQDSPKGFYRFLQESMSILKGLSKLSREIPKLSEDIRRDPKVPQQTRPAFGGLAPKKTNTILRNPSKILKKTFVFASWLMTKWCPRGIPEHPIADQGASK
jgi:hypothetical protein